MKPHAIQPQAHQSAAVEQLNDSESLIAFHGLGSGKTLTSILAAEKEKGPKLVVAPASLLGNYKKELKKFNIDPKDYHVISYEKLRKDPEGLMNKIKPSIVIADEFHRTQNPESMTGDAIRIIRPKVKKFIGLTGTIAQNHPSEIASLLRNATGKPILGETAEDFNRHYIHNRIVKPNLFRRLLGQTPGIVEEPKNLKTLQEKVKPYIHSFAGDEEYMKHIPEVDKSVVHVEMSKEQQKVYDYVFKKTPTWARYKIENNLPPSKRESVNLNAFMLGARQASTSLQPFGNQTSTPKLRAVVHDIEQGFKKDPNFKAVVYSSFLEGGLEPLAQKLKKREIPFGLFTGAQPDSERNQMVHDYNTGKLKSLLISPAGGEGLDLKGTKLMAVLDPSWNPAKINQVIGRAARYRSHEMLPEAERKVIVKQYLSDPRLGLLGKVKKFFKPDTHAVGVDEYIYNRAMEKDELNNKFTDALKILNGEPRK